MVVDGMEEVFTVMVRALTFIPVVTGSHLKILSKRMMRSNLHHKRLT